MISTQENEEEQRDDVCLLEVGLAVGDEVGDGRGDLLGEGPDVVLVLQEVHHVLDQDAYVLGDLLLVPDLDLSDVKRHVVLNLLVIILKIFHSEDQLVEALLCSSINNY